MSNKINQCIICNGSVRTLSFDSADKIVDHLGKYFNINLPDGLGIGDYDIMRCNCCSLEFSSPMLPGTDNFYNWITSQGGYYPKARWEWDYVANLINSSAHRNIKILEVGCGSGKFLKKLAENPNNRCVGLDPSVNSFKDSHQKNLMLCRTTLTGFEAEYPHELGTFDYVVAFHTLEHLSNPLYFMKELSKYIKVDGRILISTPLSPMTFEHCWHDPLNYPPHHLTRWNLRAYKALGKALCMPPKFVFPPITSLLRVIQNIYIIKLFGLGSRPGKFVFVLRAILRLDLLIKSIFSIVCRRFSAGNFLDDSILVVFKK